MPKAKLAAIAAVVTAIAFSASACDTGNLTNKNGNSNSDVNAKMAQISLGMDEDTVLSILGEPNDKQESDTNGMKDDCWYYGDSWQLCFDNMDSNFNPTIEMQLSSKSHY